MNFVQAFPNDGTQMINPMKVKGEKNCKGIFRNQPEDKPFHLRVEYQKPRVSIYNYQHHVNNFYTCAAFDFEMDF